MAAVEAITFDFWDTLCRAPAVADSRGRRMAEITAILEQAHGVAPEHQVLEQAMVDVLAAFNQHWASNRQFRAADAVALLGELLAVEVDEGLAALLHDAVTGVNNGIVPALTPNVAGTLAALKSGGIRIGIICDVGLAPSTVLRRHLAHHGVLDLFDHWSFSDEVGCFKPDPAIFDHALDGLGGIVPERAAHVGDLRRTDIAGAQARGVLAIRYAGITDDPPDGPEPIEADHVIRDHAELPALLGL